MNSLYASNVSTRNTIGEGGAAKWNTVLPFGRSWHPQAPGEFIDVTADFCQRLIANWKDAGGQGVQVNYFHKGRSNVPAPIDDKIAGAWMEDFRVGSDGLEALFRYTTRGRKYVEEDEIRYFSIELDLNGVSLKTGERVGPCVRGGALLNDPHFTTLPRLAASSPAEPTKETHTMNRKQLIEKLGLAENATNAQILAALNALGVAPEAQPIEAASVTQEVLEATVAKAVEPLKGNVAKLQVELEATRAANLKLLEEKASAQLDAALVELEPHYVAANKAAVRELLGSPLGLEKAKAIVASWPKVRPAKGEVGHGKPGDIGLPLDGAPLTASDATQKLLALAAEVRKANPSLSEADAMTQVMTDPANKAVAEKAWARNA